MRIHLAIADMPALGALVALIFGCLAWGGPARASGDFTCVPTWKLAHNEYSGCDNTAILTPGNDTRVNLILLWADGRVVKVSPPAPADPEAVEPMFDWPTLVGRLEPKPAATDDGDLDTGEGSRCRSNSAGLTSFDAEIAKRPDAPPEDEQAALIAARKAMPATCPASGVDQSAFDDGAGKIHSAEGRAFLAYLQGARAFYGGDFDLASSRFASLKRARSPWLRETGLYMAARVEVNRIQVGVFDEYGAFKTPASAEASSRASVALSTYLRAYPRGLYAASAGGLMRRVFWLGGLTSELVAEYSALAAKDPADRGFDDVDLAQEVDNKLLASVKARDVADPILLAVVDLQQMRKPDSGSQAISLADLEAQRHLFAAQPALFDYLLAAHAMFVDGRPAEVLRLIPDAAGRGDLDNLGFSRQALRGMALDAVKDPGARDFWSRLLPRARGDFQRPSVELAIAFHDERAGMLGRTFAAGSPVRGAAVRAILLSHAAGAPLLRRQIAAADASPREREIALFTLLYKEVSRGRYADYLKDVALIPPAARTRPDAADVGAYGYAESHDTWDQPTPLWVFALPAGGAFACPTLTETAWRLARNPAEARARLCLAEWVRTNDFDGFYLDSPPPKDELGGAAGPFPGPVYSRLETYKLVIADPKAPADDKAYALYRAVNCYGPSGYNHCGGTEAAPAQRKAWFLQLKKAFASSVWATKQTYYW
jgi:hypothetical protein